jgi:heat shock protein HslJ
MKQLLALTLAAPLALSLAGCVTPTQALPPGAYVATGHMPEWNLVIDARNIAFMAPNAAPVVAPTPPVIVGFAGEIYQTPRINVNIVHAACTDTMTGRAYRDRVQVDVNGRRYEGCGGAPQPMVQQAALAGTDWRVVAVNGRAPPATGNYTMNFEASRVGARFGCNSMGGSFVQRGDLLDVSQLISTKMACMGPAMVFENQGSAVQSRPMDIGWNGNCLTLSNANGRSDLSRAAG